MADATPLPILRTNDIVALRYTFFDMYLPMNRTPTSSSGALLRHGLKLSHLRLIAAVEETGQISAAASQLSMTQPAASRMLAEIERRVSAQLYQRHPRGITLNEAGLRLAERARRVLRELEEAGIEIAALSQGRRGRVEIGAVTGPALEVVLPAIRQARVTHPEIEIGVQVDTSDKLAEALVSRRLDLYLGRHLGTVDPASLELERIGPEPLSLIVREGHPLANRKAPTLADCLGYDWVLQPPEGLLRRTAELYLLEHGHGMPARIVSTASLLMTLGLVRSSNAIAPVARSVARFYGGDEGLRGAIRTLAVAEDMTVSAYSLVTRRAEPLSPAAERMRDILRGRAAAARED